jgi:hypothetical protein
MKKIIVIFLFLLPAWAMAQTTFYGLIQPSDLGLGLRIDQQMGYLGIYVSASYGNYKFGENCYLKDHYKFSLGGLKYTSKDAYFSFGLCYHKYGKYNFYNDVPVFTLTPFSFEVGVGTTLGRFCTALAVDVLKWDVSVNFGFKIIQ